jgi:hypothetical protein
MTPPTLRRHGQPHRAALSVLPPSAGQQSTNALLLARQGRLPRADVTVFADPGGEPCPVRRRVDRLTTIAATAGTDVCRVRADSGPSTCPRTPAVGEVA